MAGSLKVFLEGSGVLNSTLFKSTAPLLDHSCTVLKSSINEPDLKGPKHEIFESGFFT
jgi:hypothetical protein